MSVEMTIKGLMMDPVSNMPIIILKNSNGESVLPIWVGIFEANAIAMELQGIHAQRPMTHDLLRDIVAGLGGELQRVQITDLRDDTYFAELLIVREGKVVQVDARPSDSIALALRCDAPIFTTDGLLDRVMDAGRRDPAPQEAKDPDALRRYLEKLDPQDFGRFHL